MTDSEPQFKRYEQQAGSQRASERLWFINKATSNCVAAVTPETAILAMTLKVFGRR